VLISLFAVLFESEKFTDVLIDLLFLLQQKFPPFGTSGFKPTITLELPGRTNLSTVWQ
jgi:hypothetical protein